MSTITLYHNPRCSKSRQALQLLQEKGVEPQIRLYLEDSPSREELVTLLGQLGIEPRALLRKGEQEYKDNNLKDTELSDDALIDAMVQFPRLIERPIAIAADKAVVGRPPENVLDLV
ncbi:arsenate reductase (glutaredoxin) [Motiliproteus coralliicola]|uniref:Arsenate reductase n=1 Tax=Motiliproteus coralliicola TaxID=2283196 RepID=A0A369WNF6_9GAMM|nr:arsenate reductase (glutaredoxin) [Motiliproteus coralliicola]RDE22753.1 arsenate reductase (glutaredoxin) [Motiliproteus coralliicola]